MTRAEKIHKLSNAIREYRGEFHADSGVWIRTPKLSASRRVKMWMDRLGILTPDNWESIRGFRTVAEFRNWMKGIQ